MATRSLNKAMLIGNLTRDPELRYTPQGTPVCSFGMATNRSWRTAGTDEIREEAEFHNVVAWSKLGELCAQLLAKGRKVYIEGRLQTRSWETQDGQRRTRTEIIAEDMIVLDSRYKEEAAGPGTREEGATAVAKGGPSSDKKDDDEKDEFADILGEKEPDQKQTVEEEGKKAEIEKKAKKPVTKESGSKKEEKIDLDSVKI